jgi:hypothetical protein
MNCISLYTSVYRGRKALFAQGAQIVEIAKSSDYNGCSLVTSCFGVTDPLGFFRFATSARFTAGAAGLAKRQGWPSRD